MKIIKWLLIWWSHDPLGFFFTLGVTAACCLGCCLALFYILLEA